jgi:hypothetical protein
MRIHNLLCSFSPSSFLRQPDIPTYTGLHKRDIKFDEFWSTVESVAGECCKRKGVERSELERGS